MAKLSYEMTSWMMQNVVRRFTVVTYSDHVICETGDFDSPYAEFFFEKGDWHFLRILSQLPAKGEENAKRIRA